ncbi:alpha/beta fold hydrolase [Mariniblastus fucicola]|uniref:Pimeloyl-[acyl-carrier protein] methyl ester esterase n=1 Tax=Mariniblastus fucicola TaxID=980251 RepID=A0A5B9PF98_9BACT|nr:alpha/beta fold hydrolase [Mariniblastus fucicola]QEG25088.1 Pimeloyl-[acyl-carrier protein] methyl ester esterase [Mariniblastus fucicola]
MTSPPKIALLHGWATDPAIWNSTRESLEIRGFNVTVYTMPGYGLRKNDSGAKTLEQLVDDAIDRLAGHDIWIGWSLGAMISLEAAARIPAAMRTVVAVCGTAKFCCDQEKTDSLDRLNEAIRSHPEKAVKRFLRSMPKVENRRLVARSAPSPNKDDPVAGSETLLSGLEILKRADLTSEVNKISVPVGLISGEDDPIIPATSGRALHQRIPNSTFTALPCGHVPFLECGPLFLEHIVEFTQTVAESAAS